MDLHQDIGAYLHYIALWSQPGTIGTDFPERLERITGLSGKLTPEYSVTARRSRPTYSFEEWIHHHFRRINLHSSKSRIFAIQSSEVH